MWRRTPSLSPSSSSSKVTSAASMAPSPPIDTAAAVAGPGVIMPSRNSVSRPAAVAAAVAAAVSAVSSVTAASAAAVVAAAAVAAASASASAAAGCAPRCCCRSACRRQLGPDSCCSPRHIMPFKSRKGFRTRVDDEAGNEPGRCVQTRVIDVTGNGQADIARHVIVYHLPQETRMKTLVGGRCRGG